MKASLYIDPRSLPLSIYLSIHLSIYLPTCPQNALEHRISFEAYPRVAALVNNVFCVTADYDERSCLTDNRYKFGILYQARKNIYYFLQFIWKSLLIQREGGGSPPLPDRGHVPQKVSFDVLLNPSRLNPVANFECFISGWWPGYRRTNSSKPTPQHTVPG